MWSNYARISNSAKHCCVWWLISVFICLHISFTYVYCICWFPVSHPLFCLMNTVRGVSYYRKLIFYTSDHCCFCSTWISLLLYAINWDSLSMISFVFCLNCVYYMINIYSWFSCECIECLLHDFTMYCRLNSECAECSYNLTNVFHYRSNWCKVCVT
jgi:hypothetical protein